jgi:hypothetical protein
MKINGASGVGSASGPGKAKPASGGFSLPQAAGPSGPAQIARTSGAAGVMSVDALLALQDVGGPMERRRRSVRRAGRILDVLEDIKVGMLSGDLSAGELDKLMVAVRDERHATEDERLESVLNEIETRAAVELAKLERAKRAS